jgi:predicted nucleic-acid-binding protein
MRVTVDTNVLVRAAVLDDPKQVKTAVDVITQASLLAVSLPCLCEFVWVLTRVYKFDSAACARSIRALLDTDNVVTHRPAAEAGLALLDAGGDFADGVMAHEGRSLGGEIFVSFDKKAVSLLDKQGEAVRLLA